MATKDSPNNSQNDAIQPAAVELVVQYEGSAKMLMWDRQQDLPSLIKVKFGIPLDTMIILQRHNTKYNMYIDLLPTELCNLADSTVLKCALEPVTRVMDILPIAESTVNGDDLSILSTDVSAPSTSSCSAPSTPGCSAPSTSSCSAPSTSGKKPMWPDKFIIPTHKFSDELQQALDNVKPGLVLPWDEKREFLKHINEKLQRCSGGVYPEAHQYQMVARAIVETFPQLKDTLGSGIDSWIKSLRDGMKNKRRYIKNDPEVLARKRKTNEGAKATAVKLPKKGETVWSVNIPDGEDDTSHERHIAQMKCLLRSKDEEADTKVNALMEATFGHRRQYLIYEKAHIVDIKEKYPAMFIPVHLQREFYRIN